MSKPNIERIHLSAGDFLAEIAPFGATLTRFRFKGRDLILGLKPNSNSALDNFYAGALVGPVANRISNGQIKIDGRIFQMERNEKGTTALHSGSDGLHNQVWKMVDKTPSTVSLTCQLPDGHGGLPGNRNISITYTLDAARLTITITAVTDQRTPMNIAHHPYWALEPDQSKTMLSINARTYLPKDAKGLPTGEIASVTNSAFDFTRPQPIGPTATLDHNWCLSTEKHTSPQHAATLRTTDGLQLDITTTEVGLQVYTGSGLPNLEASTSIGPKIGPNTGIALEPQGWPDAPNQPAFPSIMLNRNKTYQQITRYIVTQT
ncbi:MAG: aldose 1-epimerase [Ascidiaceihabitans sp.]|jgi:aldose 1-epimerase